ncbi:hypothetical protein CNECB9_2320027 [Cupriavidus necator]|uniref:Uncharacterized protein n=1 Tax=Cupriavidus necator TaxID=106590 RepID=A0A1K0ID76_CUPNE|nr:hypothetical protein CNECB9_2320027 [Cupriavidus necator]
MLSPRVSPENPPYPLVWIVILVERRPLQVVAVTNFGLDHPSEPPIMQTFAKEIEHGNFQRAAGASRRASGADRG